MSLVPLLNERDACSANEEAIALEQLQWFEHADECAIFGSGVGDHKRAILSLNANVLVGQPRIIWEVDVRVLTTNRQVVLQWIQATDVTSCEDMDQVWEDAGGLSTCGLDLGIVFVCGEDGGRAFVAKNKALLAHHKLVVVFELEVMWDSQIHPIVALQIREDECAACVAIDLRVPLGDKFVLQDKITAVATDEISRTNDVVLTDDFVFGADDGELAMCDAAQRKRWACRLYRLKVMRFNGLERFFGRVIQTGKDIRVFAVAGWYQKRDVILFIFIVGQGHPSVTELRRIYH